MVVPLSNLRNNNTSATLDTKYKCLSAIKKLKIAMKIIPRFSSWYFIKKEVFLSPCLFGKKWQNSGPGRPFFCTEPSFDDSGRYLCEFLEDFLESKKNCDKKQHFGFFFNFRPFFSTFYILTSEQNMHMLTLTESTKFQRTKVFLFGLFLWTWSTR